MQQVAPTSFGDEHHAGAESADAADPRPTRFGLLAALACFVLGAKLIVISSLGSPVPIVDQWDGEAAIIYAPYLRGTLSFADLIAPHNEHRIFLTRLLVLAHLELAGEWNPRLEMILDAVLHTAAITLLAALLIPLVAVRRRILFVGFVAVVFASMGGYENVLWGFQSQIYFVVLFGILALWAFASARAFSLRWYCGLAAALLGFLSFAASVSGIVAAGAVVGVQLSVGARKRGGREYAGLAAILLVCAAMALSTATYSHALSTPKTFFLGLLLLVAELIMGLIPAVWFCRYVAARRLAMTDRAWLVLGITVWVTVQAVLLAYGRGINIAPRYMDILLLIYPAALIAVFCFAERGRVGKFGANAVRYATAWVFSLVFIFAVGGYLFELGAIDWSRAAAQQVTNIKSFFATGNVADLTKRRPGHSFDLIHPNPGLVADQLRDPDIRAILPPELRPSDADNAAEYKRMWLRGKFAGVTTSGVRVMLLIGPVLLGLGLGLFFAAGARGTFTGSKSAAPSPTPSAELANRQCERVGTAQSGGVRG